MNEAELLQILVRGEDSRHQFKRDETSASSIAAELAAFANSGGGLLLLGVEDNGEVAGLDAASVRRLNQLISNAASQNVRPPVHPITENIQTAQGIVIAVTVSNGLSKPYLDNRGRIWVKSGSDKRHVTAREEIQRLFQHSGLIYADVIPVERTSAADIDEKAFHDYFNRRYGQLPDQPLPQTLQNIGLGDGQELNLGGLLLFSKNPQRYRPAFMVKAVTFPGTSMAPATTIWTAKTSTVRYWSNISAAWVSSSVICITSSATRISILWACWKCRNRPSSNCWSTH